MPFTMRTAGLGLCALIALGTAPLAAQDQAAPADAGHLDQLRACQAIAVDEERLACFDSAASTMIAASDAGDLRVIDREDIRQTRRSLFGFSLPNIGLFGGGDDDEEEDELFTTTIASVRYTGRTGARFTTAEGAVWEMNNVPRRLRTIRVGDEVEFKPGSFGYYFVRIEGQNGVKGRRIQ
ncbi:hypothetical protein MACH05_09680 [Qipengyuania nanhaisediminis]